jgi:hypothetical protein
VAVSSFSNSGIKAGVKRNKFWDQSAVENSFFSIETINPTGSTNTVTFSNIPQTYTHLQLRLLVRDARAVTINTLNMRFNGDTGSNYSIHGTEGSGASASSFNATSQAVTNTGNNAGASLASNIFSVHIIDILDYANTNKFKTHRTFYGVDGNGSGYVGMHSGNWRSTNAITSIDFFTNASPNFSNYSSFALYGIKG